MEVSGQLQSQATLPLEKPLVPNDKETGWALGAGLHTLEKIKIICPYHEVSHNTSVAQLIALSLSTMLSYIQFIPLSYIQYP
jgi:hypothetical protein